MQQPTDQTHIRISCLGLVRLMTPEGKFVLLVNLGRQSRGVTTLSPIGGGLEYTLAGREFLLRLGAIWFEGGNDLRFVIPRWRVNAVTRWFLKRDRSHRETDARRELEEELVQEYGLLEPRDLHGTQMCLASYTSFTEPTPKDVPVKETLYLIETFDATLPEATLAKLIQAAQGPDPVLHLVTEREIREGRTADGATISASLCQHAFDLRAA